jgi:hypothetical protein
MKEILEQSNHSFFAVLYSMIEIGETRHAHVHRISTMVHKRPGLQVWERAQASFNLENNPSDWPSPTPEDKTNSSFFQTQRPKPMTGRSVRNEDMRERREKKRKNRDMRERKPVKKKEKADRQKGHTRSTPKDAKKTKTAQDTKSSPHYQTPRPAECGVSQVHTIWCKGIMNIPNPPSHLRRIGTC